MKTIDRVVQELRKRFPSVPPRTDEIWSQTPAAKLIDCVLSLNRRYYAVVAPRVQRFVQRNPGVETLSDLHRLILSYRSPLEGGLTDIAEVCIEGALDFSIAELDYKDRRRATTLLGVLKYLMDAIEDQAGDTEADRLKQWADSTRPGDYLAVGVPGFGLAGFQYLRMLFGADTVKPDKHIIDFVSDAADCRVNDVQALYLLERAARRAGLAVRDVDAAIWTSRAGQAGQRAGRR
jgi:hypothetical protein